MMILPYRIDVHEERPPIANWALVGVTCLAFFALLAAGKATRDVFVLRGVGPLGLFGHLFVHADGWHLFGNMLFLFLFGNALCSKLGNARYLVLYFASGLLAACAHIVIDGRPSVGASGAVSGVVAACLVLFPRNEVSCLWLSTYWRFRGGRFDVEAFWMIALWVLLDLLFGLVSVGNIAHWAHLGGYAGGFVVVVIFIMAKQIEFTRFDGPLIGRDQVPLDGGEILAVKSRSTRSPLKRRPPARLRERPAPPPPMEPLKLTEEERKVLLKPLKIQRRPHPINKPGGE